MKAKSVYEDEAKCDCGNWMMPKIFLVDNIEVRGWQCAKCKNIDYSDDIEKVLAIKKLKKNPMAIKVRELGDSEIIAIPKQVQDAFAVKKGEKLFMHVEDGRLIVSRA